LSIFIKPLSIQIFVFSKQR